jgi:hypothetical protein
MAMICRPHRPTDGRPGDWPQPPRCRLRSSRDLPLVLEEIAHAAGFDRTSDGGAAVAPLKHRAQPAFVAERSA